MGGSDSRCCVDSEEKTLQECASGYIPASHMQSPFQNTGSKIVRMDPRSPSSCVDRTPIRVSVTPSGYPKPLMRVQPLNEGESSFEKVVHADSGQANEATLFDPRSPAAPGSRTPILFEKKHYDVMQDPRSPSMDISRTPLLGNSESLHESNEGNGFSDWAICQTPQKHVYATANTNKVGEEAIRGVFDPRSPSDGINRTPLAKVNERDNVFSPDAENCLVDHDYGVNNSISDPRSPSEGIARTPVGKIQDEGTTSTSVKCANDPRSPNTDVPRTPLSAIFSGRRELRRTVLLSNALMASPLITKITHSSAGNLQTPNKGLDQAESMDNQNLLNIPNSKLGNFNESRSSSVVAVIGSDVDSLSNLDDTMDENQESPMLNVVDVSQDEEMDQDQEYDHKYRKQSTKDCSSSSKTPQTDHWQDQINVEIVQHIAERSSDASLKTPGVTHRPAIIASECGSSVDERFVTAKFSLMSTDDEYQSCNEVIEPVRSLMSETSSTSSATSPLSDKNMTEDINFVTTYEILDDNKDAHATTVKSDLDEINVDEFQTCDVFTNSPSTSSPNCFLPLQSGDNGRVTSDNAASSLDDKSNVVHTAVGLVSDSVKESNQEKACGGDCGDENRVNASMESNEDVKAQLSQEEKVSERGSSESSTSNEGLKNVLGENSRSDSDSHRSKNTPTTENKKKPKRRLRTPKAVARKHRHISRSTNGLPTCDLGLGATKPKSLSNSQLSRVGITLTSNGNNKISSDMLDSYSAASRSPLAALTNDFSKSCDGKAQKRRGAHSATKLPRYRVTPKATSRSLSGSFGAQSSKHKTVRNKEN